MAKGSVRKMGKKWYYHFYVEDERGNRIQKELPGTESKSETESLLRKAIEEYENQRFVSKTVNITLSDMLDLWMAEELIPSKRSNGTTRSYINTANRVKQHLIGKRKVKTMTAEHLQKFFDSLTSRQLLSSGEYSKSLFSGSLNVYAAVMRGAFRFAVFPKQLISFNPMKYVTIRGNNDDCELFESGAEYTTAPPVNEVVSESYNEVSLVCLRQDGAYEAPATFSCICRAMKKRIDGFENFHLHLFRHTYTSKLLANGAAPKDVQELLGHTDINTTLNVYAHATREPKRNSAMLLDATVSAV